MLEATEALELIQIDHTLADVIIVESVHRVSIGRPWLSLAIDVATRSVLADNGSEFHGEALTRGCAEYGIALTYRPVARPRFGAHIERLICTFMGKCHLLPGSTDSSPTTRGNYQ